MRAGAQKRDHLEVVRQSITTATTLAHERTLPVAPGLSQLVPSGRVQRGSTLAVHGVGATSLALALAAQAVRDGSFLAIVAPPSFGMAACLDFDIPLRRVVQFVLPDRSLWPQAVAAVIEGFDVVVLADGTQVKASQARLLVARARERGSVLVQASRSASWPEAGDLQFDVSEPDWSGLGQGYGHLRTRRVKVQVAGRRYHGQAQPRDVLLPASGGGVEEVPVPASLPAPVSLPRVVPLVPLVAAAQESERFAGADIDAFLDVIDAVDQNATTDGASIMGSDAHSDAAHPDNDLDAIA